MNAPSIFKFPIERFVSRESAGGIVLLCAAIVSMVLTNLQGPIAETFGGIWATPVGGNFGPLALQKPLLLWINDLLMAVFFFMVGLEIKRELLVGELSDLKSAMLPAAGALGGVVLPASIYVAFNAGGSGANGWAIPMATDIAFALGILSLAGKGVPVGLKVFLTALAIVDDLMAVLVIALFYTSSMDWTMAAIAALLLPIAWAGGRFGIRSQWFFLAIGGVVWYFTLKSGMHATIAGVLMALTIPARNKVHTKVFVDRVREEIDAFDRAGEHRPAILDDPERQEILSRLHDAADGVQTPLEKLEHSLVSFVAFAVMPIFALANAGVAIGLESLNPGDPVLLGVFLGLVIGKPIGIFALSWLAIKTGLARMPEGVTYGKLLAAGMLGGVGFTMSLFIGSLAFDDRALLESAKLGILMASTVAGILGFAAIKFATRRPASAVA